MNSLEQHMQEHEGQFLEALQTWLCIPSISAQPEHWADMQRAAQFALEQLQLCGFEQAQILQTEGHPLVYTEWLKEAQKPTLLIYGHYDVQPADPLEQWISPPFEPTLRGDQLYARGASDDKGQVMLVLKALESLMQVYGEFPLNIRVLLEGEEENGQSQPQLYGTSYFSVRKTLTGQLSPTLLVSGLAYQRGDSALGSGDSRYLRGQSPFCTVLGRWNHLFF